jgi:DDE family transposase
MDIKTSKGTIQGYNGVTSADKKHQIIIDAQAFGQGPEQSTLQPVLQTIKERYTRLAMNEDIYKTQIVVTADTGFADEPNMQYLHENNINGYIPDNQFRSRDEKFTNQKSKHAKRNQDNKKKAKSVMPASEFKYDPTANTCHCPQEHLMTLKKQGENQRGIETVLFHCRPTICRHCSRIKDCMQNPASAKKVNGTGRQVSFVIESKRQPTHTDWMKTRIDSDKGKQIYSHRMSVIEPVFGNLSNKGLTKFSLRGKEKVQCQLKLFCMIHNIEKLKNYGKIAA